MVILVDEVRSGWILDMFLENSHQYLLTNRDVQDDTRVLGRSNLKDEIATE